RGLRGDDVCDRSRWCTSDQPSVPPTLAPKLEMVEAGDHRQKQRQYRPPATSKVYRDDRPVLVIVPLEADERARAHARQSAHQSADDDPREPYPSTGKPPDRFGQSSTTPDHVRPGDVLTLRAIRAHEQLASDEHAASGPSRP